MRALHGTVLGVVNHAVNRPEDRGKPDSTPEENDAGQPGDLSHKNISVLAELDFLYRTVGIYFCLLGIDAEQAWRSFDVIGA